jgi:7tm Odorant receptor
MFIGLAYAIFFYSFYLEWPNAQKVFQATMPISFGFQALVRFSLYIIMPDIWVCICDTLIEFCEKHEKIKSHRKFLEKSLDATMKVVVFVACLHVICIYGPQLFCLINFLAYGSTVTPYPVTVPFVVPNTSTSFLVNFPLQVIMGLVVVLGFVSADSLSLMFALQSMTLVDVFKCDLDEFTEVINSTNVISERKIDEMMKKVIDSHRQIKKYHDLLKAFGNQQYSMIVFFNVYVICACGVTLLTGNSFSAVGIAVQSLIQLLIACVMGTFISHQHERLINILMMFDWYKLPVHQQKNYLTFFVDVQRVLNLEPIFIGVIDMELFIAV